MVYENSSLDNLFDELFSECSYPRVRLESRTPDEVLRQLLLENDDKVQEKLNDYDTAAERIRQIFR